MSRHELGVNVVEAHGSGQNAEAYASDFVGLSEDFDAALQTAKGACKHEPEVSGWGPYADEQSTAIAKVEEHGGLPGGEHPGLRRRRRQHRQQRRGHLRRGRLPLNRPPNVSLV